MFINSNGFFNALEDSPTDNLEIQDYIRNYYKLKDTQKTRKLQMLKVPVDCNCDLRSVQVYKQCLYTDCGIRQLWPKEHLLCCNYSSD